MVKANVLTSYKTKSLPAGKHADGHGLWLVKRDKTVGKWILRLVVQGKRREMGLGRWPDVSIAEARDHAAAARRKLREGVDPIVERQKLRHGVTRLSFKDAVDGCFKARQAELKGDGKAGRWLSPLQVHAVPKLGTLPVEQIDQHEIVRVLRPIWHDKPEAATKAMNRIGLVLKHAAALGLDVDLQATMKAKALLGKQRHEVTHIPAMPYTDVPAFYAALAAKTTIAALALRFLILTATRTSEVRFAHIDEIDGDLWVIPEKRTKTGREHRVPLSAPTLEVLKAAALLRRDGLLFPSPRGKALSDAAMARLLDREKITARPHGFRSSFRTWVEEQTDAPHDVKEAALGHVVGSNVERAYQRSDRLEKRRKLMTAWGSYVIGR